MLHYHWRVSWDIWSGPILSRIIACHFTRPILIVIIYVWYLQNLRLHGNDPQTRLNLGLLIQYYGFISDRNIFYFDVYYFRYIFYIDWFFRYLISYNRSWHQYYIGPDFSGIYLVRHLRAGLFWKFFQHIVPLSKNKRNIIPLNIRRKSEVSIGMDFIYIHPLK